MCGYFAKETKFAFCYAFTEILQIYTMHKLTYRAIGNFRKVGQMAL